MPKRRGKIKFDINTYELYWRGCGQMGDFTHIFWDCPVLFDLWKGLQKEIKQVLKINVDLQLIFWAYYLTIILHKDLTYKLRLLLAAKDTIQVLWMKA
uniref:Uncharacterized protein n=1 Tax=Oreochromis niloticus TaxID=8128 RepID=A0A669F849_ORENI